MSIHLSDGTELVADTERPDCPNCFRQLRKRVDKVYLRVKSTTPTEHPQVFDRPYVCPKCGYLHEQKYVIPRIKEDYLTDKELEITRLRNQLNGDRIRGARGR